MNTVQYYDKKFYVDGYVITRLQTGNWDSNVNEENIREIGNSGIVEVVVDPAITNSITLNTNDWGSVDLLAQLAGKYNDASRNGATITQDDFKNALSDIVVRVRNSKTGNLDRTVWLPNATVDSISWSYSVDGNGTENISLTSDADRHFFGKYRDAGIDIGTYATSNTFTVNIDEGTGIYTGLYISINGRIYDNSMFTWSGTTVTVDASLTPLNSGDRFRLFYYKSSPSNTFTELDTSGIGAIRGSYVEILLHNTGNASDTSRTLNLQSVDITANFTRDQLKELGEWQIIDKILRETEVTLNVTANEDDLKTWAEMLGSYGNEWDNKNTTGLEKVLQDAFSQEQKLIVKVYDDYKKSNLLKQLTVDKARLIGSPFSLDVGGTGQVTFNLRADNFTYTGQGAVGRLASSYPSSYPYSDMPGK